MHNWRQKEDVRSRSNQTVTVSKGIAEEWSNCGKLVEFIEVQVRPTCLLLVTKTVFSAMKSLTQTTKHPSSNASYMGYKLTLKTKSLIIFGHIIIGLHSPGVITSTMVS